MVQYGLETEILAVTDSGAHTPFQLRYFRCSNAILFVLQQ